jgi:hypothetical protein
MRDSRWSTQVCKLGSNELAIQQEKDLAEIPVLRMSTATSDDEKVAAIVKNLAGRGHSRPRNVITLANTINTLFTKKLEEAELMSLINELEKKRYIVVSGGNVSYKLPQ